MPLDPTTISTLKLWYKPESLSALNDTDPISTWTDSSASADNMQQIANFAHRPIYKTNILNGYGVARFDGSDDHMNPVSALQIVDSGSLYTVFAVAKRLSGTGTVNVVDCDDNATKRTFQFRYKDSTTFEAIAFDTGGSPYFDTQAVTPGNFNVLTLLREATQQTVRVNGTGSATATSNTAGQVTTTSPTLGAFNSGAAGWANIDLAEVLIYAGALSAANVRAVEVYLGAKFKIPGAAGPGIVVPSRQSRNVLTRR